MIQAGDEKPCLRFLLARPLIVPETESARGMIGVPERSEINAMAACSSSIVSLLHDTMTSNFSELNRISLGSMRDRPNSPKHLRTELINAVPNCSLETGRSQMTLSNR